MQYNLHDVTYRSIEGFKGNSSRKWSVAVINGRHTTNHVYASARFVSLFGSLLVVYVGFWYGLTNNETNIKMSRWLKLSVQSYRFQVR